MSCEVKFEKGLDSGCLLSIAKDVLAGRMSLEVAQKILWVAGCAISSFGDDAPEQESNAIFVALDSQEPTLELIAKMLHDVQFQPKVFAAGQDPTKAIDPATLLLLIQFGKLALEWIQSRRKR